MHLHVLYLHYFQGRSLASNIRIITSTTNGGFLFPVIQEICQSLIALYNLGLVGGFLGGGVDCQGWLLTTKRRQAYTRYMYGGRAAARPKVPSTHGKGTTTTSQIQTKHEYNAHGPHDCLPDALMM
jgi:hypothetical protein